MECAGGIARNWGSKILRVLRSARVDDSLGLNVSNADELQQLLKQREFDVDLRERDDLRREVESMSSLQSDFAALKNWEPIEKEYAFAKTHIGRPGSRFPEDYLDWMGSDPMGVRLKTLARSNQLLINATQARRADCGGVAARCICCDLSEPETIDHFMLRCPTLEIEREKMIRKVVEALDRVDLSHDFNSASHHDKLLTLLGKQTGCPKTDRLVDRAVRKYLKNSWSNREDLHSDFLSLALKI